MLTTQPTERSELAGADMLPVLQRLAAGLGLQVTWRKGGRAVLRGADGKDIEPWREGYPYPDLLRRRPYQVAKQSLQIELLKLQQSVKASGQRLLIVVEGRDAAGKGGAIRRFTENLNPRGTRVVALEKPAAHEQGDNYLRRFLPHCGRALWIGTIDPDAGRMAGYRWFNNLPVGQAVQCLTDAGGPGRARGHRGGPAAAAGGVAERTVGSGKCGWHREPD